jgi:ABC-type amino acid transport system permease subunit
MTANRLMVDRRKTAVLSLPAARSRGPDMTLDFDVISRSLPYLWKGFLYTVQLTAIASVGGLFFGRLAMALSSPSCCPTAGYVT